MIRHKPLVIPPISRQDAIAQGQNYYFTGEPCVHGHIAKRHVAKGRCHACKLQYMRESPKRKEWQAQFYRDNADKIIARNARYRQRLRNSRSDPTSSISVSGSI